MSPKHANDPFSAASTAFVVKPKILQRVLPYSQKTIAHACVYVYIRIGNRGPCSSFRTLPWPRPSNFLSLFGKLHPIFNSDVSMFSLP